MDDVRRNKYIGILGTVAFHFLVLIFFLTFKLGEVREKHQDLITIEFVEEDYKPIEQIIEDEKPKIQEIQSLSQQDMSNIASNTAEKLNEDISTEKFIDELMNELGIDELNPVHDNNKEELPSENINQTDKKEDQPKEESSRNFGQTRITYNLSGRKGRHIYRPTYRCQGGGTVIIGIIVNNDGLVVQADITSSSTNEQCVMNTALEAAKRSRFNTDLDADKRQTGTFTYVFVAQ